MDPRSPLVVSAPELLATVGTWLEGPCWVPARRSVVFSDIPGNRVWEWGAASGRTTVLEQDCGFANGRTLSPDGSLVECSHGRRAVQRRVLAPGPAGTGGPGEVTTLVDRWEGRRLNSPNDVVVDSRGAIWFTDPAYGIEQPAEGHPGEREYGDRWVFRLDPDGSLAPVVTDVLAPNGLAFSPDESSLYVADSSGAENPSGAGDIRVYDVVAHRLPKNGRLFGRVARGVPDGIRVDEQGRVWTSAADGVHVFGADGSHLLHVPVPEVVANLCFGQDGWVYLTATTSLYRFHVGSPAG